MPRATILFVDDEENVRNALRRVLRRTDYQLLFADGPEAALDLLQKERIDIVVSDHLMPRMNGLDLLKLIRERQPEIVRIMLTGHTSAGSVLAPVESGDIFRFLSKPWDEGDMLVTFHQACERLALERENRRLASLLRVYETAFAQLKAENPGLVVPEAEGVELEPDEPLPSAAPAP
jgi:DNA-binding NtrC family response regulator